ncbi:hypothetical protein AgCh_017049 [Apium graveolens]
MQRIPYASAVESLMYAQVCTHPDIAFIIGMLGRYLGNPGMEQWKVVERVLRYLKKTKDYMLIYRKSDHLEIIGYSDFDFGGCKDERKSTSGYVIYWMMERFHGDMDGHLCSPVALCGMAMSKNSIVVSGAIPLLIDLLMDDKAGITDDSLAVLALLWGAPREI